jgi:hypothetical protein
MNVIKHMNESRAKNLMIISIDAEKNFGTIQHTFIIKPGKKLETARMNSM